MKFKENWKEIIRYRFGKRVEIVITNVDGDVDLCGLMFPNGDSKDYVGVEGILLIVTDYDVYSYVRRVANWHKEHEEYDTTVCLTKEEFLDLVKDKETTPRIESKLTNVSIEDIRNNNYIEYNFDGNFTSVKIGDKIGQSYKFKTDKNDDLTGLVIALMDAFGKSKEEKIKVSNILLGIETENKEEDEYIEITADNCISNKEFLKSCIGKKVEYKLFESSSKWKVGKYAGLFLIGDEFPFLIDTRDSGSYIHVFKIRIKK